MFYHIDCFMLKMGKLCSCETLVTVYQSVTIYQRCSLTSQNTTVRNTDFEVVIIFMSHSFLVYFYIVWSVPLLVCV